MSTRIHTFTVEIYGPEVEAYHSPEDFDVHQNLLDEHNQKVVDNLRKHFDRIRDAVEDELPEDYFCEIR